MDREYLIGWYEDIGPDKVGPMHEEVVDTPREAVRTYKKLVKEHGKDAVSSIIDVRVDGERFPRFWRRMQK